MKMDAIPENDGFCSRCGDELIPEELSPENADLCAFCEQMRSEALQIYAEKLKSLTANSDKRNLLVFG